jgi:hypothetical protein
MINTEYIWRICVVYYFSKSKNYLRRSLKNRNIAYLSVKLKCSFLLVAKSTLKSWTLLHQTQTWLDIAFARYASDSEISHVTMFQIRIYATSATGTLINSIICCQVHEMYMPNCAQHPNRALPIYSCLSYTLIQVRNMTLYYISSCA